ncbi:MAG: hypothetical protein M3164_04330 [Actinomycetota bacterium]|nr:hypothetical protein [Actinomycetota bacterium]
MAGSKRRGGNLREDYARIRKPLPPPEKVESDRRRGLDEVEAEREIEEFFANRREEKPYGAGERKMDSSR